MEEDIKLLEEFLSLKTIDNKIVFTEKILEVFKEPIRNLIARNKELEIKQELLKILQDKINEQSLFINEIKKDYIPKSKVREKKEELKEILKNNLHITYNRYEKPEQLLQYGIDILEELLEERN